MSRTKFAPLCLGGVQFVASVALAPIADMTNAVFRDMCLEFSRQGLPVELTRPEVEQGRGQATHETEMVTTTCDVTMSANKNAAVAQAHIKAAIDATPRSDAPEKAQVEGMSVDEMVTAKALWVDSARSWVMVRSGSLQVVKSIQLYEVVREDLAWAASELVRRGSADHIDLSFGCPVPKVIRKGGGSALPWKTAYLDEVVVVVVTATRVASEDPGRSFPVLVTVKIRSGIDAEHRTFLDVARAAKDNGMAAVILHTRTTSDLMGARGFTVSLGLDRLKG